MSQSPDQVRLIFSCIERNRDFKHAIEGCNQRIAEVRAAATKCGIPAERLKTTRLGVEEDTEYESGRRRHVGFLASHELAVTLPLDRELIGKFLSAVMVGSSKPQLKIVFEVADGETLKQKVLANAVENAKTRAQTIALAAGVVLGPILQIEYGYGEVRVSSESSDMGVCHSPVVADAPDFDPEDVDAEDTVTITWELI